MQIGFTLLHHDHDYVERRGGVVFLSHLRGGAARAEYRAEAIRRAGKIYTQAASENAGEEALCGAALITLQRAAFAAEDLGGLLHALLNDDPEAAASPDYTGGDEIWPRLTSVTIPDLRDAFHLALTDTQRALATFRLPDDTAMATHDLPADVTAAATRLRNLVGDRWGRMLQSTARFWLAYGDVAKATMHGFTVIAGRQFRDAPGAGAIGDGLTIGTGPTVVFVNSTVSGTEVNTPRVTLGLDAKRVASFVSHGVQAARLTGEFGDALANGIQTGHAYGVPDMLSRHLSEGEREALRRHIGEASDDVA